MIGKLTALTLPENQAFACIRRWVLETIKIAYFNSALYRIYRLC